MPYGLQIYGRGRYGWEPPDRDSRAGTTDVAGAAGETDATGSDGQTEATGDAGETTTE